MPNWGKVFVTGRPAPQELVKKIQKSLKVISSTDSAEKREQELKHIR